RRGAAPGRAPGVHLARQRGLGVATAGRRAVHRHLAAGAREVGRGDPLPRRTNRPVHLPRHGPETTGGVLRVDRHDEWQAGLPGGRPVGEPLAGPRPARRLVFSPDGVLLAAVGGAERTALHVWDAATGKALFEPVSHAGENLGAWAWPGPGRLIAVGKTGIDVVKHQLYTWDLATGKPVGEPLELSEPEFDADGGRMLASGRVYDTRTMTADARLERGV